LTLTYHHHTYIASVRNEYVPGIVATMHGTYAFLTEAMYV
jgi:hypothetical protein